MKFMELDARVRERVLEQYAQSLEGGWWDRSYEDFVEVVACFGFDVTMYVYSRGIPHIAFSGFSSQGSGASFSAVFDIDDAMDVVEKIKVYAPADAVLHKLAESHLKECTEVFGISEMLCGGMGLRASVTNKDSHYCHEMTMRVDAPSHTTLDFDGHESEDLHEAQVIEQLDLFDQWLLDCARDLARWMYKALETEYYYLISEEALCERGLEYDEEGNELEEACV